MKIRLISSGKTAVLTGKVDADLFIDCRGIVNPFRNAELMRGGPEAIDNWMWKENRDYITAASLQIQTAFQTAHTRNSFKDPNKPLTVCFFCLAGQHRSPAMKRALGASLKAEGFQVEVA